VCGVGGIVGAEDTPLELLERMAAVMAHRGPDGTGFYIGARAGLAFRRLAIIDLHERSNQPLAHGPWRLVMNGEIYNYVELRNELRSHGHEFVTEGDAEVLLHAWDEWGVGALDRVNGMFAFAIWNEGDRELTLACDPFGEKPLYWSQDGGRLVFASDIPAILKARPELAAPQTDVIGPFLASGHTPPVHKSFFSGIHRLPGAHLLRWRNGRIEIKRYWSPQPVEVPLRFEDAADELRELLRDSVRLRLRSDVPVGTSLSGGIDSSTVVSLCSELAGVHMRHAFTASFPGFSRDETPYARSVAADAGVVEHHVVEPTVAEVFDDLDAVVRDQQEPFGSLSIYAQWRVMRAAREAGIVVLLDGQGADELFAGYEGTNAGWALRSLSPVATIREVARGGFGAHDIAFAALAGRLPSSVGRRIRLRAMSPYVAGEIRAATARVVAVGDSWQARTSPLVRELLLQTFHTSLPALLRYADRDSMAHGREVRLPFLDRRVAEFAFSVPTTFLYSGGVTKRVLREAMRGIVPDAVLGRRDKIGFEPPQATWLSSRDGMALASEVLLDDGARARGLYNMAAISHDIRTGSWRDHHAIWRAISVELWLRAFARTSAGAEPLAA
jgi:asparagine synthase (glutamine-hydrolysing)